MHYDLLNNSDIHILECRRIERFRSLFLEIVGLDVESAILNLTLDNSLIISCGKKVSALIMNVSEVHSLARYVLGISKMEIYHVTQLVYSNNILEEISNKEIMTVATEKYTVEREALEESSKITAKITKSLALADIATDLDAAPNDIHSFLTEQNATLIDFGGIIIVPESEAVKAYEYYSLIRARQKMLERFATPQVFDEKLSPKNTATSRILPKKPTLTFKREFKAYKTNYKRTMQNFLQAMFPDSPQEQEQALADIVQQNEMGLAYLDKIARTGDYKDKQLAKDLLFKAAAEVKATGEKEGQSLSEPASSAQASV